MNKLINQLSTAAAATPAPSVDFTSILHNTLLQSLSTVLASALQPPTQPATTVTNQDVSEKPSQATKTNDTVPQYRPTPIAELERRKRVQQQPPPPVKLPTKPGMICALLIEMMMRYFLEAQTLDSDDYVQATFSPPSNSSPPPVEETKAKVPE